MVCSKDFIGIMLMQHLEEPLILRNNVFMAPESIVDLISSGPHNLEEASLALTKKKMIPIQDQHPHSILDLEEVKSTQIHLISFQEVEECFQLMST